MTTIYLIRHGQASVGTDNYDVLSQTGETQAAILGQHLANTHIQFDAVYSGTLKRQIDTATIATSDFGVPLQTRAEFNEYRHKQIFDKYLPVLAQTDTEISTALADGSNGMMTQSVFSKLMMAWVDDSLEAKSDSVEAKSDSLDAKSGSTNANNDNTEINDIESWQQFNQRIIDGLDHVIATHPAKTIAIFTSGGVITSVFRHIFSLPPKTTFEMNWNINNAGITAVKHRDNNLTLREYNNISHLLLKRDKKLITQI